MRTVERKNIGGKEKARTRALTFEEIETKVFQVKLTPMMRYPLCLMLLTGLRSSEAIWVLKNKQTKDIPTKGELHTIPAIPAVLAVIKTAPTPPTDTRAMAKALRRLGADFTPHDLRRTFATRLGDLGVMPHVVEKLLGHKMEGVMAVYNRAEFWNERTDAMRLWARELSKIRKKARTKAG
jgi:integrase